MQTYCEKFTEQHKTLGGDWWEGEISLRWEPELNVHFAQRCACWKGKETLSQTARLWMDSA